MRRSVSNWVFEGRTRFVRRLGIGDGFDPEFLAARGISGFGFAEVPRGSAVVGSMPKMGGSSARLVPLLRFGAVDPPFLDGEAAEFE